jgi:site-specific recombinase XerD
MTNLSPHYDLMLGLVTASVTNPHTLDAYSRRLKQFFEWLEMNNQPPLNKSTVKRYRATLQSSGRASATINQALAAIRKMSTEAADSGMMDERSAAGISRVKNVRRVGRSLGHWLDKQKAEQLLNTPDIETLLGKRDRAILAVMVGTGLRRTEVTKLNVSHLQKRNNKWMIVDLVTKHGRVHSVPVPGWAKQAIDQWLAAANIKSGAVFLPIHKSGSILGERMNPQTIYALVVKHATAAGLDVKPHDLRRSAAMLALNGGASMRQIQKMLGHASILTTERYLDPSTNLDETAGDFIRLEL